jgi:hypothetical protein
MNFYKTSDGRIICAGLNSNESAKVQAKIIAYEWKFNEDARENARNNVFSTLINRDWYTQYLHVVDCEDLDNSIAGIYEGESYWVMIGELFDKNLYETIKEIVSLIKWCQEFDSIDDLEDTVFKIKNNLTMEFKNNVFRFSLL